MICKSDSRWIAYLVGVTPKERDRLTKEKKPIHNNFVARNLATGDTIAVADITSFNFSADGGFISMTRYAAEGKRVQDVLVQDLANGTRLVFSNVGEQGWSDAKPLFAFTVIIAVLAVWKHRGNIERLRNGTEHRFTRKSKSGDV